MGCGGKSLDFCLRPLIAQLIGRLLLQFIWRMLVFSENFSLVQLESFEAFAAWKRSKLFTKKTFRILISFQSRSAETSRGSTRDPSTGQFENET